MGFGAAELLNGRFRWGWSSGPLGGTKPSAPVQCRLVTCCRLLCLAKRRLYVNQLSRIPSLPSLAATTSRTCEAAGAKPQPST